MCWRPCGRAFILRTGNPVTITAMECSLTRTPACVCAPAQRPERRYLTILFCDLVGYTYLTTRLDPENLLQLIRSYRRLCTEIITNHGGFIAHFIGDGVMIYFGYPRTREDDAERAVGAALNLLKALNGRNFSCGEARQNSISIRMGIASGLVLLDVPNEIVIGAAPNLAARLQAAAQPDTIVISDATRSMVKNLFRLQNVGMYSLHGYQQPIRLWRVISKVHTRNLAAVPVNLSEPLSHAAAATFIRRLAGKRRLPPHISQEIITRSDGIPLFLKELTRAALHTSGSADSPSPALVGEPEIPEKVCAMLMAKLDRQPLQTRCAAQIGATLGREFGYALLAALWPYPRAQLDHALELLCGAEVLVQMGTGNDANYRFKWGLMQEVAYQSTLKEVRQGLRRQIDRIDTN